MRGDARLAIRSRFLNKTIASKTMDVAFAVLLPAVLLAMGVLTLLNPAQDESRTLLIFFGLGAAFLVYGIIDTRPIMFTLDTQGIFRKDFWSVRRIALPEVARICRVARGGKLNIAIRSRAGSLLTLYDDFADEDKAMLLEALERQTAPHGVAVEQLSVMPPELFGFEDIDSIRRAGEHVRRASTWTLLLGGFGFMYALFAYVSWKAVQNGEDLLLFILPILILALTLMAISVIARRRVFLEATVLVMGGFIIFMAVYPMFGPPFWTGPGPQTMPSPLRALLLFGGVLCVVTYWLLAADSRRIRAARS